MGMMPYFLTREIVMVALNRISQYTSREISVLRFEELVSVDIAESMPGNRDGFHCAYPVHEIYKIRTLLCERNDISATDKNYVFSQLYQIENVFYRQIQFQKPDSQSVIVPLAVIGACVAFLVLFAMWSW